MTPLALVVLAVAAQDPVIERLVQLASELDLATFAPDPRELCTDAAPGMDAVPLASLAASALERLGLPEVRTCPGVDGDEAAKDRAARDAGAEWRLVVRPDDEGLALELRAVDRGLWGPRDLGAVLAYAKEPPPALAPVIEPPPRTEPGVSLVRGAVIERPIRALAACDLNSDGTRELIGVSDDRVMVWRESRGVLALRTEWSFVELPRAAVRVRDPIAGCVCGPFGPGGAVRLAIGHSDLERGVILAVRAEGTGLRLERERALSGIPLGQLGAAIIGGVPDQGRARFAASLTLTRGAEERAVELSRPILEIASAPGSTRAFALDLDYAVFALTDHALGAKIAVSGAGTALVVGPDGRALLATTSRVPGLTDQLRLVDAETGLVKVGPIAIPGSIVAAAGGSTGELFLAAHSPDGARTTLYRLTANEVAP